MSEPTTAAGIHEAIVACHSRLEILHAEGRLTVTPDAYNAKWRDPESAYEVALRALEWAREATEWMITLPEEPESP